MTSNNISNWNATKFFENLTRSNRLATAENFVFLSGQRLGRLRGSTRRNAASKQFCVRI